MDVETIIVQLSYLLHSGTFVNIYYGFICLLFCMDTLHFTKIKIWSSTSIKKNLLASSDEKDIEILKKE